MTVYTATVPAIFVLCCMVVGLTWLLSEFAIPRIDAWLHRQMDHGLLGDLFWLIVAVLTIGWDIAADALAEVREVLLFLLQCAWIGFLYAVTVAIRLGVALRKALVAAADHLAEHLFTSSAIDTSSKALIVALGLYLLCIVWTAYASGAFEVCQ